MEMLQHAITPYELEKRKAEDTAKERCQEAESSYALKEATNRHDRRAKIAIERLEMKLLQLTGK